MALVPLCLLSAALLTAKASTPETPSPGGAQKAEAKRPLHALTVNLQSLAAEGSTVALPTKVKAGDLIRVTFTGHNPFVHKVTLDGKATSFQPEVPKIFSAAKTPPEPKLFANSHSGSFDNELQKEIGKLDELAGLGVAAEQIIGDASYNLAKIKDRFTALLRKALKEDEEVPILLRSLATKISSAKSVLEQAKGTDECKGRDTPFDALEKTIKEHEQQLSDLRKAWDGVSKLDGTSILEVEATEDEMTLELKVVNTRTTPESAVFRGGPYHLSVRQPVRWFFGTGVAFTSVRDQKFRVHTVGTTSTIETQGNDGDQRPVVAFFATWAMPVGETPLAWGPSLGLGTSGDSRTNYFAGISLIFPLKKNHLGLTLGYSGTYRKELDSAYRVGETIQADPVPTLTQEVFRTGLFLGLSYQF